MSLRFEGAYVKHLGECPRENEDSIWIVPAFVVHSVLASIAFGSERVVDQSTEVVAGSSHLVTPAFTHVFGRNGVLDYKPDG
jgi:hypothetical protein